MRLSFSQAFQSPSFIEYFLRNPVGLPVDLSAIEDTYTEERGFPPYHPCMMVKVLLYAYEV